MIKNNENPKVTIVIPVYNGSNYIKEAIDSALSQTYKNIEVIVVNDGSSDNGATENIVLSYGEKVKYFYKQNGGVATALNYAIERMTGDYFSWLSHDDMYFHDKIERQIAYLQQTNLDRAVLYSDFEIFEVETGKSCVNFTPDVGSVDRIRNTLYLLFGGAIHGCTLLLPRKCFDEIGLFSEKLRTVQDYDVWFRLLKAHYEFRHIEGPLIITRHHKGQGTLSMAEIHRQEVEALYIWAFDEFYEHFQSFSHHQVASFVLLLKNKMLTAAPDHIVNRWPGNQNQRDDLQLYIQHQKSGKVWGALTGKLAGKSLLSKLKVAKKTVFAWMCRSDRTGF